MIYLIVVLFILLGVVCFDYAKYTRARKGYYVFLYVFLILIAGLRYKVGGDTFYYMEFWEEYPTLYELFRYGYSDLSEGFQPLWYFLSAFCRSISPGFTFFQIVHAVIVNSVFAWFFWRYAKLPFFATLFYALFFYLYYNTEVMRASLAVSMILLGYPALQEKRWFQYYFWCILALGFHLSAIFCLVFPVFHILKKQNWKWIFVFVVIGFVLSYSSGFLPFLLKYAGINEVVSTKIEYYGTQLETLSYENYNVVGWIVWFCTTIVVPAFLLSNSDKINDCSRGGLFLWALIMVMNRRYGNLTGRLTDFLFPFCLIMISNVIFDINAKTRSVPYALSRFSLIVVLVFFSYERASLRYFKSLSTEKFYELYYPYSSIWDKTEYPIRENLFYLHRSGG